jgi:hypothetical protein
MINTPTASTAIPAFSTTVWKFSMVPLERVSGASFQQTMEQPLYRADRVAPPSALLVRFSSLRESRKVLIATEETFT